MPTMPRKGKVSSTARKCRIVEVLILICVYTVIGISIYLASKVAYGKGENTVARSLVTTLIGGLPPVTLLHVRRCCPQQPHRKWIWYCWQLGIVLVCLLVGAIMAGEGGDDVRAIGFNLMVGVGYGVVQGVVEGIFSRKCQEVLYGTERKAIDRNNSTWQDRLRAPIDSSPSEHELEVVVGAPSSFLSLP
eukprot:TRINITY_DN75172_c0_g1_i1.p1 TRINITY_DN75172_c0_g1~~TRINITY_DN75172_c0_g1_i1.p1  ORF type:complete len:190 (-),score=9.33 TRINITY_DN75172_c0_g1_i1:242-811(-)